MKKNPSKTTLLRIMNMIDIIFWLYRAPLQILKTKNQLYLRTLLRFMINVMKEYAEHETPNSDVNPEVYSRQTNQVDSTTSLRF